MSNVGALQPAAYFLPNCLSEPIDIAPLNDELKSEVLPFPVLLFVQG